MQWIGNEISTPVSPCLIKIVETISLSIRVYPEC